jgi:hypothetical protein
MIHNAQLVTLKLDILQNFKKTSSLSIIPLQDCKQKNNYMKYNCELQYTVYKCAPVSSYNTFQDLLHYTFLISAFD